MRKGNSKKTNFTKIARRALASALSLSMVLGVNIVPAAAADANDATATASPVATGAAVDFSADGVILSSGNEAKINGTELTFGTPITDAAAGVRIVNPFAGDKKLTDETLADALVRTGGDNNFFIYRYPDTTVAFAIDSEKDKFYVAPFASVEDAQLAASNGSVKIVESIDDLTYATREAANSHLKSEDANFDPANEATAATKIVAARLDQLPKKTTKCVIYKDADGYYTAGKYKDKFEVKTVEEALAKGWITDAGVTKINAENAKITEEADKYTHVCRWVIGTEEQAMQNWDTNYTPTIMNLAQANRTGTSSTAVNVVNPTWENGVSISMWVKAASKTRTPIITFSNDNLRYHAKKELGNLVFYTDGSFVFAEDSPGGSNGMKANYYSATFTGGEPTANVNKWVQVTLNIKNDGFEVFYNGVKATCTPNSNTKVGKSGAKYFNYSYGYAGSKASDCIKQGYHAQRLRNVTKNGIKNFSWATCSEAGITAEEYFAADDGGFGFYKYYDSTGAVTHNIMEYISEEDCRLFVGGDDGKGYAWLYVNGGVDSAKYTDNAAGMGIKDLTFNDALVTADEAKSAYVNSTIAVNDVAADESTDATAVASYDYTIDEETETVTGVAAMNDAYNSAEFSKDEYDNTTIVLGETTDEGSPRGVQLDNPYAGNKALVESVATALERTGLTLEAWTYKNGDAYRIADKASKAEAIAQYETKTAENLPQYERTQVWAYAKATQATKAIVANGDGTTEKVVTEEAVDATCTVAEVILANAQAANNSKASALANINNFWKQYNVNTYTNEQVIGWAMGNIESVDACVEANKLGQTYDQKYPQYASTANPADTADVYSYPYPSWNTGVTFSTWVKAATDAAATVLEFTDKTATLNLSTTGKLVFQAGDGGNIKKNTYQATFDGATPAKNVGEWVYVTVKVKNDNIEVYYNGEKATKKMNKAQKDSSYFNYGTGYATDDTAVRIATMVQENGFMDILKGFGDTTDYLDFTKYTMRNSDGSAGVENIMKFLTSIDTQLYLGGMSNLAKYDDINAGMEFGAISFYDVLVADETIADQYVAAKATREESKGGEVTGDPVNPSGDPVEPSGDPVNPSGNPVEPSGNPVEPSGNPVEPSGNPVEPSGNPVEPTGNPVEPTGNPVEPTGDPVTPDNFKAGDADCSGKVDLKDAKMVLKLSLGITVDKITEQGKKNADYDKSGKVDLNDAKYTLKEALGIPVEIKK